jgi:hypothetical protein
MVFSGQVSEPPEPTLIVVNRLASLRAQHSPRLVGDPRGIDAILLGYVLEEGVLIL